jgi:hypothetical protein
MHGWRVYSMYVVNIQVADAGLSVVWTYSLRVSKVRDLTGWVMSQVRVKGENSNDDRFVWARSIYPEVPDRWGKLSAWILYRSNSLTF